MCVWHHRWCNTSPLVLFDRACHAFSITVSLNWRDLEQKIVQSSVWPVRCWKLSYYRKGVLRWGGGNNVWGKPPLKMDLVKVEEKHIPKPGVRRGNDNSLNNNDYKLLSVAERWQDSLKEPAEHWCFKERGAGCVFRFEENKGTTVCSINTRCQHKQLHWEEAVSERR